MWFLLFLAFPFAEIYGYVVFAEQFSFFDAVLLVITSGVLGLFLLSFLGRSALFQIQRALATGQAPGSAILHQVVILLGAFLIFVPGMMSDILGVLCLLPGSRHFFVAYLKFKIARGLFKGGVKIFGNGFGFTSYTEAPPKHEPERDATVVDVTPLEVEHKNKPS